MSEETYVEQDLYWETGHHPLIKYILKTYRRWATRMEVKGTALILILVIGLLVSPRAAQAQQQTGKVWRIGVLMSLYPPDADVPQGLREGLRTLGYVEGQNLVIEWRYAQGRDDRLPTMAAEMVRLNMDVIVTDITLATRAAMHATSTIPIVMGIGADAVGAGLVSNLGVRVETSRATRSCSRKRA